MGSFQFDLVAAVFGGNSAAISRVVYVAVGSAAVFQAYSVFSGPKAALARPVAA